MKTCRLFNRLYVVILRAILFLFLISCSSNSTQIELESGWNQDGLSGKEITIIENDMGTLLVGTEQGLFLRTEEMIESMGLGRYEIKGAVRLKENGLLAGAISNSGYSVGDVTLFKSKNQGKSWVPFLNNFGGEQRFTEFSSGPLSADMPSDTVFINKFGTIVRSADGGKTWKLITGQWGAAGTGLSTLLYIDPYHKHRLWSGGVTGISQPYLWKSINYKKHHWANVSEGLSKNAEAIVYDVITHPNDSNLVLVGLGGAFEASKKIKKSTDGGKSWQMVLTEISVRSFVRSQRNPNIIYASGRSPSGKLFFVTTSDFGETWEQYIFKDGPSSITTNDLGVMTIEGDEVLFLGTNQGLYSYRF